jgi:SAM-dependent methyltransferase
MDYNSTKKYWDEIFAEVPVYKAENRVNNGELERCFKWLGEGAESVIDFGCGNGRALYRAAYYGSKKVLGIDISAEGIDLAKKIELDGLEKDFVLGGVESLKDIEDASFEGGILFNILDNISPSDCETVLNEIHRILGDGGKLLIKLNPEYDNKELDSDPDFTKFEESLYLEESGVYFYNITDHMMKSFLDGKFNIVDEGEIEFKDFMTNNRIYLLEKSEG